MVYASLLNQLCRSLQGAQGALMLDSGGEIVVGSETCDDRLKLIGAYQGIALAAAQKASERYAAGAVDCLSARHEDGSVLAFPLKDGYYLVLALGPGSSLPLAQHRSVEVCERLNAEI